ncbi:hypothetical protein Back11_12750 [Paenibacillus baekrokdamisoli]|uniref:Uncharacterized protein n=1 Tax=Paenibacillus baekrokdamisoli TaxID=1712516 RepID=A0A3G9IM67_9BACL|nr:hypothetical protein Back11_12750 [Paenibacillus baekrokdamisoli]
MARDEANSVNRECLRNEIAKGTSCPHTMEHQPNRQVSMDDFSISSCYTRIPHHFS